MDAINALIAGTHRAQAMFDASAARLASADLPTPPAPDVRSPDPANNVDVADQMTTMIVAADMHHVTAAALRAAVSTYQDSLTLGADS